MNIVLIMAGGLGSRMNQNIPKQFIEVKEKPIIIYTLEEFEKSKNIDKIVIVCKEGYEDKLRKLIYKYNIKKVDGILKGGSSRQESVINGIEFVNDKYSKDDLILIHDAARPLISEEIIEDNINVCKIHRVAITAIEVVDTIFYTDDKKTSTKEIKRDNLMRIQTPETFILGDLVDTFKEAQKKNINDGLCTSSLYLKLGKKIFFSKGSRKNIKITSMEDLENFMHLVQN